MWLGLVGRNCSGKDTVAHELQKQGFQPISTSDIIREEVNRRSLPKTRASIQEVVKEWREQFGSGILAQKVLETHAHTRSATVFSLRHPEEIRILKQSRPFLLIHIEVDTHIRFQRSLLRNREHAPQTLQAFIEEEQLETTKADKKYFDLAGVESMADITIHNNKGLQELQEELKKVTEGVKNRIVTYK